MIRKIIRIDEDACNGCGLCADACHEGAIEMVDGKARLVRENFCDGFGDCLPACPTGAITLKEREAPAYDEQAVKERQTMTKKEMTRAGGCPGAQVREMTYSAEKERSTNHRNAAPVSRLGQWPCQIKLVPSRAPFFSGANLLVAADCTAFAYAGIHEAFMRGKITLIGCPKLDGVDYTDKLTEIIACNDIKSLTILRMEVPCCGGLQRAAEQALRNSGRFIPWQVVTISRDGTIIED